MRYGWSWHADNTYISLPPGYSINTAVSGLNLTVGKVEVSGFSSTFFHANPIVSNVTPSGTIAFSVQTSTAGAYSNAVAANAFSATDVYVNINASIPILGWSSSVQVSDGYDGRVVAANVCRNAATANQSIPNATYTGVGFDFKNFDTTNDFTLSPSINGSYFTVKSAGYYRVSASITFTGNGTNARILAIAKNIPSGVIEHLATSAGTAAAVTLSGSRTIYANAGDKIYISAYKKLGRSFKSFAILERSLHRKTRRQSCD